MIPNYKVGDLILSFGGKFPDIAEILEISEYEVKYQWLGLNDMPIYDFAMSIENFNQGFDEDGIEYIPCDSEQQKLAIILKYS